MVFSLETIPQLLTVYGYALLFPIAVIEGPIISIIAGFLISGGILNLYVVYVVLLLGDLVGDTMYYCIGRYGGNYFVKRWGWFLNIDESKLIRLEESFNTHSAKWLFFAKAQGLGSAILVAAGVIKMPFGRFLWLNFLATLIKSAFFLAIGFYFGKAYIAINGYVNKFGIITLFIIVIGIILYFLRHKKYI
ncbi:MAG: VTT domain-containing protein [Patescibacteria group bacterium]